MVAVPGPSPGHWVTHRLLELVSSQVPRLSERQLGAVLGPKKQE